MRKLDDVLRAAITLSADWKSLKARLDSRAPPGEVDAGARQVDAAVLRMLSALGIDTA